MGLLSRKYSNVQLTIPVQRVPQNVFTISPITGIAPIGVFPIASLTRVPKTTLAPVASIFVAARSLSPSG